MAILGLNAYHGDSAAALLIDGQIVAAAEEERFNRIKHWSGFPRLAIEYCLREGGISLTDLEYVAVNRKPTAALAQKIIYAASHLPSAGLVRDRLRNAAAWQNLHKTFAHSFPDSRLGASIQYVEHHLAHVASSFLVGPFDRAALLSVDGFGDFTSTLIATGEGASINGVRRVRFPSSLGLFYQAATQHIGFPAYGDEYKAMGLAPYGEPRYLAQMRQILKDTGDGTFRLDMKYFRHGRERHGYVWFNQAPSSGRLFTRAVDDLLGPARDPSAPLESHHKDLACSTQARYEEVFLTLVRQARAASDADALCIAGGCGMNSVANGKILASTDFTDVYVPPAPADAGGAVGAASFLWSRLTGRRPEPMTHAYLGPGFTPQYHEQLLDGRRAEIESAGVEIRHMPEPESLCTTVAGWIGEGLVVGWYQGRMEWGPRALGNRSILCDPRRADIKDLLNQKIKRRESFRPFAPSILREFVSQYFEVDYDVPFMSQVFSVRPEKRSEIPGVVHVDGTGRLQTVSKDENPLYWTLIDRFRRLTNVPLVLNTSFNENEPIVNRPEEALECFLRTSMDVLVLGEWVLFRGSR
ncbi:MAG: carbamoyltransferase [Gemmatimonadetes bacterium]|nr:carbamoyltransferase [Gemmatimonadota bacterium]